MLLEERRELKVEGKNSSHLCGRLECVNWMNHIKWNDLREVDRVLANIEKQEKNSSSKGAEALLVLAEKEGFQISNADDTKILESKP